MTRSSGFQLPLPLRPGPQTVWGTSILSVSRYEHEIILTVAGGSWQGRREQTVLYRAKSQSEAVAVAEIFEAACGVASGADLWLDAEGAVTRGGVFVEGRWQQAVGDRSAVPIAEEGRLQKALNGEASGAVVAATLVGVQGWGDRLGLFIEGGRVLDLGGTQALVEQTGELWYQPLDREARDHILGSIGAIGELWVLSNREGRAVIIRDTTGERSGRRLLLTVR